MSSRSSSCIVLLLVVLLSSACSTTVPPVKERFFFPTAPAEPKIEYLKGFFSQKELKSNEKSFMTEYVLGEDRPRNIFTSPVDVASDGKGRVFVADSGARQVIVLDLVNQNYRSLPHG